MSKKSTKIKKPIIKAPKNVQQIKERLPEQNNSDDENEDTKFKSDPTDLENDNQDQEEQENDNLGDDENEVDDEDKEINNEEDNENDEKDDQDEVDDKKKVEYDEDKCIYNYADDKSDDELELVFDDDTLSTPETSDIVPTNQRRCKPILTKYERTRILGDRTQQLTLGAKPLIKNVTNMDPKSIAEEEIKQNIIPLIIRRPLPNGKKEIWYIRELKH